MRSVGAFAVVALMATLLVQALTSATPASAGPPPVMTGFIPLPANQFQDAMENINTDADSTLDFTVGITNNGNGAIMYYDHWEDGYEADIANPVQPTTEVWGDGNTANGNAGAANRCGTRCSGDVLTPGDVFVMRNNVPTPHNAGSTALFDGRDKVASTRGFTITAGGFSTPLGSYLAGVVSAYDTSKYGTSYVVPVGQNTASPSGTSPAFETSSLVVMAAQNNTTVRVDADANGTYERTDTINQGGVVYVDGGVMQGARIQSDKPVQVHEGTGDVNTTYESRWFTLFPTPLLSSDYLSPVGTGNDNQRTIVYLHNPTDAAITVTPTCTGTGCGTGINVAAHGTSTFATPLNQAVRFQSTGNIPFAAVGGIGAQSGASPGTSGDNSSAYDWGFTLVPTGLLTTQAILGWAPGNSNNPPASPSANRDDDPVWITTLTATKIHVDYDGDPTTGVIGTADCIGAQHDAEIDVAALASTRIHDPNDGDMTGARVYTCDGTKLSGAWGEDPVNAPTGLPGFDAGYQLIPTTTMIVNKTAAIYQDVNGDGKMSPGDVIEYDIAVANAGNLAFASVNAHDVLPPGVVYQASSTTLDVNGTISPIADSAVPPASTAFPLDESGASLPDIPAGATVHLKFRTTVVSPRLAAGTVVANVGCVDAVEDDDQANPVSDCDTIESQLTAADLSLVKTQTASPKYVGDSAVFHLVLANAGPDTATGVQVTDLLPAGTTYVGSAPSGGTTYNSTTGIWNVGSLASGASATLDITATINTTSVTNYAQVTAATAADTDSQPGENPLGPSSPPDQDDESSATVTVAPRADLELQKVISSGPASNGDTTFLITLTNKGPQAATNTVVQDLPPAGATYVGSTPGTGTFASATNQWTVPSLAPNTSTTLQVTYKLTTFPTTNFAQVISTGQLDTDSQPAENPLGPSNPPDQDDEASAPVPAAADLSVTKTEATHPTTTGAHANFTVTVTNSGYAAATGVNVTDKLPAGLAYVGSTPSVGTYNPTTGVWTVGNLAVGASATLTIDAVVTQPGTITNTAELTASDQTDPDSTPNNHNATEDDQASASVTTTAASLGDRVWFDADGDGVQDAGEPGIAGATVTVLWAGPDGTLGNADDQAYVASTDSSGVWSRTGLPSGNYRVTVNPATLPSGITTPTFDLDGVATASSATLALAGGATRTDVDFGYRGGGTIGDTVFVDTNANNSFDPGEGGVGVDVTLTWFGPNGASGGGDDLVYTTTTDGSGYYGFVGLPPGTFRVVVDHADLPGGAVAIADPDGGADDTSTLTLTAGQSNLNQDFGYVVPSIDLSVTKTDNGASTTPGGTVAYTIGYANIAGATTPATGVVLTETIPANSTFSSTGSTSGWSCNATTCTFAVGSLAPGGSSSVTFAVKVSNPLPAGVNQIANTVTVDDDHTHGSDPTPGNNTASDATPVTAAPDLTVSKTDNGVSTTPGGTVAYTISYANVGNQGATGVVLTETIPANSTFDAAGSTSGWSCNESTCTFAMGSLAAAGSGSVTFAVKVNNPLPAGVTQLANSVTVADDGTNGPDPTPSNNTGTDTTPIVAAPDLHVSKSDGGATIAPNGVVVYTISYGNEGSIGAGGVTLTESVPAGSTFVSAQSTAGWSCVSSTCTYTVGSLAAGATGSVTFAVRADFPFPSGSDHLHNSVAIGHDKTNGTDPDPGDDTGTDDTPVLGATVGDTVFFDVDGDGTPDAGEGIPGATVTVTWAGPNGTLGDGDDVALTATTDADGTWLVTGLPAGTFAVSVTTPLSGVANTVDPDGGNDAESVVVLAKGDTRLDQDFGFEGTGTIGDTVFLDRDHDGTQDADDPGRPGVTVTLLVDADGNGSYETTVGTAVTDADGHYAFEGLYAAPYRAVVTVPDGYSNSSPTQVDHTLAADDTYVDADFAIAGASVGDRVWNDLDGDGVQDEGEPGLTGVAVTLWDSEGNAVADTTTDADGAYRFDGLPAGDYLVEFGAVTGFVRTEANATQDASDSDATPSNGRTALLEVAAGAEIATVDAGYYATSSLTGRVFDDHDGDGVADSGEPGIADVTVTLTGTDDLGSAVSVTTTTDANGNYSFAGLRAGTYTATETQPVGYADGVDHEGTSGGTAGNDVIASIALAPATHATGYTFAEYRAGTIGDTVFSDTDGDGVQDGGEPGLGGVLVTLLQDTDGDGTYETTVDTTTSAGTGTYAFTDLAPGAYRVVVVPPSGQDATTPTTVDITLMSGETRDDADFGFEPPAPPAPGTIGDRVWNDVDGDGAQDPGEVGVAGATVTLRHDVDLDGTFEAVVAAQATASDGSYGFTNVPPGSYQVTVTVPSGQHATTPTAIAVPLTSGQAVTDADFGLAATPPAPGSIGDRVWDDVDGDGGQDAGETGVNGVTVTLLQDVDGDGTYEATVASTVTDGDGNYLFDDLAPGSYRVVVMPPDGMTATTSPIVAVALSADQHVTDADVGLTAQPPAPASIGDRVWSDSDHDGGQDPGEAGVNGVTVTLLEDVDGDGTYETTVATTVTDGDGNYLFDELDPGRYLVVVTPPDGMAPTNAGAIAVVVAAGDVVVDADVGLATPPAIPFDLALQKDLLDELEDGGQATWRLVVTNNGPGDAADPMTVTDVLPTGVSFVSASGDDGWECAADGPIVTCTLEESVAAGDARTLDLLTTIDAEPGTELVNDAAVAADGPETTLTNNTDDASGTVRTPEEPPTSTTSTTTTSTTSTTSATVPPDDGDPTTTTTSGTLPTTGASSSLLALIGLALLGAGVVLVAARRRLER